MIHIPNDIYKQIANYAIDNGSIERENHDYADSICNLSEMQFECKGMAVEIDGWVSISYYKSREMWGTEYNAQGASSCLSCKTWSETGAEVANDFDDKKINDYFIN